MTNKELKDLIMSIAITQKETAIQMKKSDEQMRELRISQSQTDAQINKTDKEIREMSRTLKNLGINVDGINKTTGLEAEEFFYTSIDETKMLNSIKFDSIAPNLTVKKDGRVHEIDIFLENGSSVGIIEVKNKVKEQHLEQLQKIVDNFYFFHPTFKDYKIIPAIAGKVFPKHIQKKALDNGFVVITQVGKHIELINPS
jgi:hypothetical protein